MVDGRRRRRQHSDRFKAEVLERCRVPGVSLASVAMAHGLNANLVRRWLIADDQAPPSKRLAARVAKLGGLPAPALASAFIPLTVQGPAHVGTTNDIRVEVRSGAMSITVSWPLAASGQCAAWLRELLR